MIGRNQKWLFLCSVMIFGLIDRFVDCHFGVLNGYIVKTDADEVNAIDIIVGEYEILGDEQASTSGANRNFSSFTRTELGNMDIPASRAVLWMMQLLITDYIILFIRGYHKYLEVGELIEKRVREEGAKREEYEWPAEFYKDYAEDQKKIAKDCAWIVNFLITKIDTTHFTNFISTLQEKRSILHPEIIKKAEIVGEKYTELVAELRNAQIQYLADKEGLFETGSLDSFSGMYPKFSAYVATTMYGTAYDIPYLSEIHVEQDLWKRVGKFKELLVNEKNITSLVRGIELKLIRKYPDYQIIKALKLIQSPPLDPSEDPELRIVKILSDGEMKYLNNKPVPDNITPI